MDECAPPRCVEDLVAVAGTSATGRDVGALVAAVTELGVAQGSIADVHSAYTLRSWD